MPFSRSLYDNLPQHLVDADTEGHLAHIVSAIQADLDIAYSRLEFEEHLYDVDLTPANFQDWLGQLVGLERVGTKYLGIGLNPDWSYDRKKKAIDLAWVYWQILGTRLGINTAIEIWLGWQGANDPNKLELIKPFGDRSTQHLPGWWNWATGYSHNHLRTYPYQKQWGVGANPGRWYVPLDALTGSSWQGGNRLQGSGSGLAPDSLRIHARPKIDEWNLLFPDLVDLAPEMLGAAIEPTPIGWLDFTGNPANSIVAAATNPLGNSESEICPTLGSAIRADNWTLVVTTADGIYSIRPVTIFTYKTDYRFFENRNVFWSVTFNRFYVEFIFRARTKCRQISRLEFKLAGTTVDAIVPIAPLTIDDRHEIGVKFDFQVVLPPYITISAPGMVIEGNTVIVTVFRGGDVTNSLTVPYTVNGSAISGADYQALSGTVTIPAGASSATISIATIADILPEGSETISISLGSVAGYTQLNGSVTIAIVDPALPEIGISAPGNVVEGSSVITTVTRTGSTTLPLTLAYSVSGSATPGVDYQALSGTVTILAGASSATIAVTALSDTLTEGSETIVITLDPLVGYTLSNDSVAITIVDFVPQLSIAAPNTVAEGSSINAIVTRTGSTTNAVTATYSVTGSATPGVDYQALSGTVTILAGASSATISVAALSDFLAEGNETIVITLDPVAGYTLSTDSVSIVLSDVLNLPTISIFGNGPTGWNLVLSRPLLAATVVNYTIQKNSALAGNSAVAGSVTFLAGTTTAAVAQSPIGGDFWRVTTSRGRQFYVGDNPSPPTTLLSSALSASGTNVCANLGYTYAVGYLGPLASYGNGYYSAYCLYNDETVISTVRWSLTGTEILTIASSSTYTIVNNNVQIDVGTADISIYAPTAVTEGDTINAIVARSGSTASAVTVTYVVSGTATPGTDYQSLSGSVTIPVGAESASVAIVALLDALTESSETIVLTLNPIANYTQSTNSVSISLSDVLPPNITISAPSSVAEGNAANATVSRSGSTTNSVTFTYTTSGTATPGTDYQALSGSVTIPAGASSGTISIVALSDLALEGTETVIITLNPLAGYTFSTNSATISITNVAPFPAVSITANGSDGWNLALSSAQPTPTTVNYSIQRADVVYGSSTVSGSVTFASGITTAVIAQSLSLTGNFWVATTSKNRQLYLGSDSDVPTTVLSSALSALGITACSSQGKTNGFGYLVPLAIYGNGYYSAWCLDNDEAVTLVLPQSQVGTETLTIASNAAYTISNNNVQISVVRPVPKMATVAVSGTNWIVSLDSAATLATTINYSLDTTIGNNTVTTTGSATIAAGQSSATVALASPTVEQVAKLTIVTGTGYKIGIANNATINITTKTKLLIRVTASGYSDISANSYVLYNAVNIVPGKKFDYALDLQNNLILIDQASKPLIPALGAWTIDWWSMPTPTPPNLYGSIFNLDGADYPLSIYYASTVGPSFFANAGSQSNWILPVNVSLGTPPTNVASYCGLRRTPTAIEGWRDGVMVSSELLASNIALGTESIISFARLGASGGGGLSFTYCSNLYIEEFRISTVARDLSIIPTTKFILD